MSMGKYQTERDKIRKFIESKLGKRLREDQEDLKILSEGDLQSCVYHHLSDFFKKKKFSRWFILNKLPMGKKQDTKKIPDIVIVRMDGEQTGNVRPIFLIELKETEKYKEKAVEQDIRKLAGLIQKYKKLKGCFFVYSVYDDKLNSEEILEKIKVVRDKYLERNQKRSKIFSIPINAVHEIKPPHSLDIWRKKRQKLRKFRQ